MSIKKGRKSEDVACFILKKLGFSIVKRNYYTRYGEIDIVAFKDDFIHIIEVKSTYTINDPANNFGITKYKRLLKSSKIYCYRYKIPESVVQIDLLLINRQENTYRLISNANLYFH